MNILTYGSFDCLHWGHLWFLSRAAGPGDKLFVGLSTDAFQAIKGKPPMVLDYRIREKLLKFCSVDVVFPEESWEQKHTDFKTYSIDLLVMGDDWNGKFDEFPVKYLQRTPGISASLIRSGLDDLRRL